MKKTMAFLLSLVLLLGLCCFSPAFAEDAEENGDEYEEVFADWNPEAPALNVLIDYVEAVTD